MTVASLLNFRSCAHANFHIRSHMKLNAPNRQSQHTMTSHVSNGQRDAILTKHDPSEMQRTTFALKINNSHAKQRRRHDDRGISFLASIITQKSEIEHFHLYRTIEFPFLQNFLRINSHHAERQQETEISFQGHPSS